MSDITKTYRQLLLTFPFGKIGVMPGGMRILEGNQPRGHSVTRIAPTLIESLIGEAELPRNIIDLEIETRDMTGSLLEEVEVIASAKITADEEIRRFCANMFAAYMTEVMAVSERSPANWKEKFKLFAGYWQSIGQPIFSPGYCYPLSGGMSHSFEVTEIDERAPVYKNHLWGVDVELILPTYNGIYRQWESCEYRQLIANSSTMNEYDLLHSVGSSVDRIYNPRAGG